ncbi:hypothetical protein GCM10009677_52220 [Sphaerisporangium rubeum]|uniref:Biotin carboxyl carrier protein of acetyl-CoA carboxylase n=1 Tax=Sphaerisporangium rubeum TaxID=321317 RepID=A0A7X0IFG5_9ACTN|nr:biotin/lipoyl-containing protein [Sphaerisporangium rubeum]MBB6473963.1 acetyl-CoA carboxylase biotin carboxyl carrier protein [Sphaerisporangium rubeum]
MTADITRPGGGATGDAAEQVLDWVVRHAARLGEAGRSPLRRIRVSTATLAVDVEWAGPAHPAPPGAGPAAPSETSATSGTSEPDGPADTAGTWIRSPMVGTFYRSREPGAPPFVEVGDVVEPGQQIGIVEAMKLMNPVQSERRGRVSEITARDGCPVQYDDPLLALAPVD